MENPNQLVAFIDTQIFVAERFEWNRSVFKSLKRYEEKGIIRLVSTEILEQELIRQLLDRRNQLLQYVSKVQQNIGIVRSLLSNAQNELLNLDEKIPNADEFKKGLQQFFIKLNFERIEFPSDIGEELFDLYFSGKPPFGAKGKKSEFPDAANLILLQAYQVQTNCPIHVVSGDSDWERTCEKYEDFIHVPLLSNFIELAAEIEAKLDYETAIHQDQKLQDRVVAYFEADFEFYKDVVIYEFIKGTQVNRGDGILDDMTVLSVSLKSISPHYSQHEEDKLVIGAEIEIAVDFSAYVSLYDVEFDNWLEQEIEKKGSYYGDVYLTAHLDEGEIQDFEVGVNYIDGADLSITGETVFRKKT